MRLYSNPKIHCWFLIVSDIILKFEFYLAKAEEEGVGDSNFAVDDDNYDEDREVQKMASIQIY